jgi:RNA polymerase sigma-70 factor, ECF subfamily
MGLHAADLLLACACARGDAAAHAVFEARHLSEVGRIVASLGSAADSDDTCPGSWAPLAS